jgi:hypothetical protein
MEGPKHVEPALAADRVMPEGAAGQPRASAAGLQALFDRLGIQVSTAASSRSACQAQGQQPLELVGLGAARDHPLEHVGDEPPPLV